MGPYIWGFFWKFPFNNYEYLGRIAYIFFYIMAIFSFSETLKINNQLRSIFSLIIILATYKYNLFNGDSDVLIFIFLLLTAKFVNDLYQPEKKKNQLTIIFILLGIGNILIWLKQEGIVFFMFLIFSAIIFNHLINKKNKLILVTSCFLLILLRVLILQIGMPVLLIENEWSLPIFDFQEFYYRTTKILFYTFVYIVQNPIYLISLPLMIISIKILKNNPLNKLFYYLHLLFLVSYLVCFFFKQWKLFLF